MCLHLFFFKKKKSVEVEERSRSVGKSMRRQKYEVSVYSLQEQWVSKPRLDFNWVSVPRKYMQGINAILVFTFTTTRPVWKSASQPNRVIKMTTPGTQKPLHKFCLRFSVQSPERKEKKTYIHLHHLPRWLRSRGSYKIQVQKRPLVFQLLLRGSWILSVKTPVCQSSHPNAYMAPRQRRRVGLPQRELSFLAARRRLASSPPWVWQALAQVLKACTLTKRKYLGEENSQVTWIKRGFKIIKKIH